MAIIEAAFGHPQPFTAEQLLIWSRRRDPRISRATVYRTLPLLLESGYLKERNHGADGIIYTPNFCQAEGSCHILCQDCGRVVEFDHAPIDHVLGIIVSSAGLKPVSKTVKVKAKCQSLEAEGHCDYARPLADREMEEAIASSPVGLV